MPDNTTITSLGSEVPLRSIDRSLKQLWAGNEAMTRASAMNFAILSERPGSLEENTGIIQEVTREHACRALLIALEPGEGAPAVRAWITAHCQLAPSGKKSVCSEQIALLITGRSSGLVANTIFSNVDSDLPLTLWWQGAFSSHWTPELYTEIDRLVIDSCEWADPLREFAILAEARANPNAAFTVNDIAWTRVLHFRLALAACFDDPAALAALPAITRMDITHAPGQGVAARMFISWATDRPGWTLQSRVDAQHFRFQGRGSQIIDVHFSEKPGPAVSSVTMTAPDLTITLTRDCTGGYICGEVKTPAQTTSHLTPCPCDSQSELIVERLRLGGNTTRYFRWLTAVKAML